jgi:hypothetical protein
MVPGLDTPVVIRLDTLPPLRHAHEKLTQEAGDDG